MKRGRKPGSLGRFTCSACGTVELARGGSNVFRCTPCRDAGVLLPTSRQFDWRGKDRAAAAVKVEILRGRLPHPSTLKCVDCDKQAIEYEHRDYNKPLTVEPICRSCNLMRGPAIPLHGAVERMLERGICPYHTRRAFEKLCRTMGRPEVAAGLSARKLTVEDWRHLWPLLSAEVPTRGAGTPTGTA